MPSREDGRRADRRARNVAGLTAVLFIVFTSHRLYEEAIPRPVRAEETTCENLASGFWWRRR